MRHMNPARLVNVVASLKAHDLPIPLDVEALAEAHGIDVDDVRPRKTYSRESVIEQLRDHGVEAGEHEQLGLPFVHGAQATELLLDDLGMTPRLTVSDPKASVHADLPVAKGRRKKTTAA